MRITKMSLQNFRAFDGCFELDLAGGKNLLLHGENGAGKSSLYFALKRFFEERGDSIANHHNHFAPATRSAHVRVELKGTDTSGTQHDREFHWDEADGHPLTIPKDPATAPVSPELRSMLVDGARRTGFLDYRAMLRTNLLSAPLSRSNHGPRIHDAIYGEETKGLEAQLFDLVSLSILAGVRVTTARGGESTVGSLMRNVWENRSASRHKWALGPANAVANAFNQAFNAILPQLEAKLTEFLNCGRWNRGLFLRKRLMLTILLREGETNGVCSFAESGWCQMTHRERSVNSL